MEIWYHNQLVKIGLKSLAQYRMKITIKNDRLPSSQKYKTSSEGQVKYIYLLPSKGTMVSPIDKMVGTNVGF